MSNNCIYGKYPVQEIIYKKNNLIKKLWYTAPEYLQNINNLQNIPSQQASFQELRQNFKLKETDNIQGLLIELKCNLHESLIVSLEELLLAERGDDDFFIWLPSIQDTHNLGAIIRSVVALGGVKGIIIPHKNSVKLTATVAKISAGAIFSTNFAWFKDYTQSANLLTSSGFNLIAIHKSVNSQNISEINFTDLKPFVLVFGGEELGIPFQIQKKAIKHAQIPQTNLVNSLNISVAVGITLHQVNNTKT